MKKLITGTLLFVLVSFVSQAVSHFVINAGHYASVPFMRPEPIFPLGFLTMIMQGLVLSYFFVLYCNGAYSGRKGLIYGLIMSALFVSYPALVEPAKYQVPSIAQWVLVEGSVGLIQFCLFGILMGLVFRRLD